MGRQGGEGGRGVSSLTITHLELVKGKGREESTIGEGIGKRERGEVSL